MPNEPTRRIRKYVDPAIVKRAGNIQSILGSLIIILSGVFLFTLSAMVFYITVLVGFYIFFPGIMISLSIVTDRGARSLANYMPVFWLTKN